MLQAQLRGLVHSSSMSPRHEIRAFQDSRMTNLATKSSFSNPITSHGEFCSLEEENSLKLEKE